MWKFVVENACDHGYPVVYYDPLMRFSTTASKFPQFVLDSRMVLVYTTFAVKKRSRQCQVGRTAESRGSYVAKCLAKSQSEYESVAQSDRATAF